MSYSGLYTKYKINRPLTYEEKAEYLDVKQEQDVVPNHVAGVIKMNSTYMDTVNKYYMWMGRLTSVTLFMAFPIIGGFLLYAIFEVVELFLNKADNAQNALSFLLFVVPLFVGALGCCTWVSLRESFKWTHYPIRFNRKTRTVYAFRLDGTILEASWDALYFHLAKGLAGTKEWEIHAHVLADDKETVLETFALAAASENKNYVLGHWEFIRRYMEKGPKSCYFDKSKTYKKGEVTPAILTFCNDVDNKRESPAFSRQRLKLNFYGAALEYYASLPFIIFLAFGRMIAMKTCKVPIWAKEIEEACPIAEDDPYIVTATDNLKITLTYGEERWPPKTEQFYK